MTKTCTTFFQDLNLRYPDIQAECKSKNIQEQIAKIIQETGNVMDKEKPDAILILGDTNSGLSVIAAKEKKYQFFILRLETDLLITTYLRSLTEN